MHYAQLWQVLSVIFSDAAFTYDIVLVITLIIFFIRYQKTMQALLTAFITMNMNNSDIPSIKANSISRTFPPLITIKIPEEEQIVEDLQEIESMQFVVQVIMVIVCIKLHSLYCTIVVKSLDICTRCSNIVSHFFLFQEC